MEFVRNRQGPDTIFVVDCNPALVIGLGAVFLALPFLRRPLVALDLVLRRPLTWRQRLAHPLKRFLLARADLYLNYFADVRGLAEVYGISPKRCVFVPFKPNLPEPADLETPGTTGDYVLCFGISTRFSRQSKNSPCRPQFHAPIRPNWRGTARASRGRSIGCRPTSDCSMTMGPENPRR
jgi:hypothetical protein